MKNVYIIDSIRTAIGRMGGTLKDGLVDFLAATVLEEIVDRTGEEIEVDEVMLGQTEQSSDSANLGRVAALRASLPVDVPRYTVHRQCGSGLQAINNAHMQIQLELSDVIIAGGAESMSTPP